MSNMWQSPVLRGQTLDVQVLQGLETYIATEDFLHKLEHASAEWIDLSEHQHLPPGMILEQEAADVSQVSTGTRSSSEHAVAEPAPVLSRANEQANYSSTSSRSGLFAWGRSTRTQPASGQISSATAAALPANAYSSESDIELAGQPAPALPAAASDSPSSSITASVFEVVDQQPPLHQDIAQQEPFVLVSADDAIEGMAYYIALYLSRAPEARYMEPKQLQAALKQTFTAIRRSRYKVLWDWGRCLYRWGAVSYSALQLYEHPWLVRAVVAAIWTSSKMACGLLV